MAFLGFTSLSATPQSLSAQLFATEAIHCSQEGVGLYSGKTRSAEHDNGTLHLTSHRLIYLDARTPESRSCALDLALIRQTEFWAGFLKSSAKITLLLGVDAAAVSNGAAVQQQPSQHDDEQVVHPASRSWVCRVCGMSNAASPTCALCGVPQSASSGSQPPSRPQSSVGVQPNPQSSSSSSSSSLAPRDPRDNRISCPACTFLNHPSMHSCEICETSLQTGASSASGPSGAPSPASGAATPASTTGTGAATPTSIASEFVKLSFRKGGEKVFYDRLRSTLKAKAWQMVKPSAQNTERFTLAGIDGILRTIDTEAADRTTSMQSALTDLEALMAQAKEMVDLAQSLNAKLASNGGSESDDTKEATMIKSSLQAMGMVDVAVTPEMARSRQDYAKKLATELDTVLRGRKMLQERGIVGLDEAWCLWNRARGVSLVSPKDFKEALQHLPPSVRHRTFKSGLTVLHTPQYSQEAFTARMLQRVEASSTASPPAGESTIRIAQVEGLSVTLVAEMCEAVEMQGDVCRDEQGGAGLSWWPNLILSADQASNGR